MEQLLLGWQWVGDLSDSLLHPNDPPTPDNPLDAKIAYEECSWQVIRAASRCNLQPEGNTSFSTL